MNKDKLLKHIANNEFCLDFEFDEIGQTWGVSYIRLVSGSQLKFESMAHFFFSCLHSEKAWNKQWLERADLERWAVGLCLPSKQGSVLKAVFC